MLSLEQVIQPVFKLRPYQVQCVEALLKVTRPGNRVCLVAPTASGKTVMATSYMDKLAKTGHRILFCVHLKELIEQTWDKLQAFGLDCGFIKAGYRENRSAAIQVASIQTLNYRRWWEEYRFDVVMLDEVHITGWSAVAKKLMEQTHPEACYVGLTATPWRTNPREGFADIFQEAIVAPLPYKLMEMGFLCPIEAYYGLPEADLSDVHRRGGDYKEDELANACDQPDLIRKAVQEWLRLANYRRTIAFAVNIEHSKHIRDEFLKAGVPAAHIDGTMDLKKERKPIYEALARGDIQVVTSVSALSVGFDCPPVEVALLCRPTESRALHFQQIGRILRLSPKTDKKSGLVLDQAGNILKFGFVEDLDEIDFDKGRATKKDDAPTKKCPKCSTLLRIQATKCSKCGYEYPAQEDVDNERSAYAGNLVLLEREQMLADQEEALTPAQKKMRQTFRGMLVRAYKKGWSPGKAFFDYQKRYKQKPHSGWYKHAVFGPDFSAQDCSDYWNFLRVKSMKLQKDASWIKRFMTLEFGETWRDHVSFLV